MEEIEELRRDEGNQLLTLPRQNIVQENAAVLPRDPEVAHQREGAPPPPPPPPPIPPRPKMWRFPEAEFGNKGVRR